MEIRYKLHLVIPNIRYGELLFRHAALTIFHEGALPDHVYQDQLQDLDWTDEYLQTAVDSTFSEDEVLALTTYLLPMYPDSKFVFGPKNGYEPNEAGVKLDPGSHDQRKRWFIDFDPEPPIPVRGYFNAKRDDLILPDVNEHEPHGYQGPAHTRVSCNSSDNMCEETTIRGYIAKRLGIDENELDLGDPENILDAPIDSELGRTHVETLDFFESFRIPPEEFLRFVRSFFSDTVRRWPPSMMEHLRKRAAKR